MTTLRRILLAMIVPTLRLLAGRHARRRTLRFGVYRDMVPLLLPGDVIVTARSKSLTGALIPGAWSHAALVATEDKAVHAIYPQVARVHPAELVLASSRVAVLRPRFADRRQRRAAVQYASEQIGKPYDLEFEHGVDAFYCSELVWRAYREAAPQWGFEARERLGVPTVTPSDLYDAHDDFDIIGEWGTR